MLKLAWGISRYIEYLRGSGLSVSVHFEPERIKKLPHHIWEIILPYNSHANPYCMAVKARRGDVCLAHQVKIRHDGREEPYVIECHAGVREYIFPVYRGEDFFGYVAVSGYLGGGGIVPDGTHHRLPSLKEGDIPTALADTLVPPLVSMLRELFLMTEKLGESEENMMSQYLAENHTNITFDNFCRHFSRSRSYMSHKFKSMFGTSFADYCNALRLEDARRMLLHTDEGVTDIALCAGFGDVSYFIRLFKEKYGASPLKYRKQREEKKSQ